MRGLRALLDRWKVRYLIARKPTAANTRARGIAGPARSLHRPGIRVPGILRGAARTGLQRRHDAPLQPVLTAKPGVYDDIDPRSCSAAIGSGATASSSLPEDRHLHRIPGAEIGFAFEGSELTYVFTKAPNRGIAAISIDGVAKGTFDLYSADPNGRAAVHRLGPGRHLLVIHVTGESRAGAKGTFVDLDALGSELTQQVPDCRRAKKRR